MLAIDILRQKRPNIFVIENVKGLLSHLNQHTDLFADFKEYSITPILLNSKDCGVCQSRERVFIIGIKKSFGTFTLPEKVENNQTFNDVINAVKGNNYGIPKHSDSLVNKLKYIPQGGCVLDIPEDIRPRSFKNSYSRLCADKIPPTITRNYNCPSSANCIHPFENRGLSDAEALYIQGFPCGWQVQGKTKNLQIGNAVPPKMIEWVMKGIKLCQEQK
jgi:DNA (cytosine-5)-methyltransferase 1